MEILESSQKKKFWHWFELNESRILGLFSNADTNLMEEITMRLKLLDKQLVWEIGPSQNKGQFFAISPNGDRNKLNITRDLILSAYESKIWDFFPAKPKKVWKRKVEQNKNDVFDFNEWKYHLKAFNNREFFDVYFVPPPKHSENKNDLKMMKVFAVSELGEELYLKIIGDVSIDWNASYDSDALTFVEYLEPHIMSLLDENGI